jgi:hypothetical protein
MKGNLCVTANREPMARANRYMWRQIQRSTARSFPAKNPLAQNHIHSQSKLKKANHD